MTDIRREESFHSCSSWDDLTAEDLMEANNNNTGGLNQYTYSASSSISGDDNDDVDDNLRGIARTIGTLSTGSSFTSSLTSGTEPEYGELYQLLQSVEEDAVPLSQRVLAALERELSTEDILHVDRVTQEVWYGHPLSEEEAWERMPEGKGGLNWNATIIPDDYFSDGKLKRGLSKRDFDLSNNTIKPRRPSLPVTASDFFSSLTKIKGSMSEKHARYIFHGVLNGWPSLRTFELISLEQRRDSSALPTPKELLSGQILWVKCWTAEHDGVRGIYPQIQGDSHRIYRARLRGAPWSGTGWSKDSQGFCFWYESHNNRISYGSNMLKEIEPDPICTHVHMVSHRYAVEKETARNKITYHSICLLEWDHGKYCTVLEAAFLNGIGGYKGQSNWYDDRDEPVTQLYKALPPELVCPWKTTKAEIRCYDVKAKTLDEFKAYLSKYEGNDKRFIDPQVSFSHAARLTFRSKRHIAQYMINYIRRDPTYAELKRNCQTFTADVCSFLAGKKNVAPFHPVSRIEYQNRTYLFLYDSHMYKKKGTSTHTNTGS